MNVGVASRTYSGPADGQTVAELRELLRHWLTDTVDISGERTCDIVLAASEALANCAEHAYRRSTRAGTMTLSIVYDRIHALVELLVTDDGQWVARATPDPDGARGRGLPLIEALADECVIDGHPRGTTVRMRFAHCPARSQAAAQAT